MKWVGVGVEGPSDKAFWDTILHREFKNRGFLFDVRNMDHREKLIRDTPKLYADFREAGYLAGFILVDRDNDPCVTEVLNLFESTIRQTAKVHVSQRDLFVCVAIRELESWFLADETAIQTVLGFQHYSAAPAADSPAGKTKLIKLLKESRGKQAGYNEISFAREMAKVFTPANARPHSNSFDYFWGRLEIALAR
jgi:hypothetical protein